jgi:hypothetical protein
MAVAAARIPAKKASSRLVGVGHAAAKLLVTEEKALRIDASLCRRRGLDYRLRFDAEKRVRVAAHELSGSNEGSSG